MADHDHDDHDDDIEDWLAQMQGMVVGGVRGMAEAHTALVERGRDLPPLDHKAIYQAAILLAATILEANPACENESEFERASQVVGREVKQHMHTLRQQRDQLGEPTLRKVLARAGLERHHRP